MSSHTIVDVVVKSSQWQHITYLTDVHWESDCCDVDAVGRVIAERRKMPNHRFIIGGDLADWISHTDAKRHTPTARRRDMRGRVDFSRALVKELAGLFKGCTVDVVCPGNHEDEWHKRHEFDPTHALAERLGCARGEYEGVVDYVAKLQHGRQGPLRRAIVRVYYHHGKWASGVAGGIPPGFSRLVAQVEGARFACCGHNHGNAHVVDTRRDWRNGREVRTPLHLVVCGSFVDPSLAERGGVTQYAVRGGCRALAVTVPLLSWRIVDGYGGQSAAKNSVHSYRLESTVSTSGSV